jgi:hypothetical protein
MALSIPWSKFMTVMRSMAATRIPANILGCFGLHDRPWPERPVFGTIRYMSLDGVKRRIAVNIYIRETEQLERTP